MSFDYFFSVSACAHSNVQVFCRLLSGKLRRPPWGQPVKAHFPKEISSLGDDGGGCNGRAGQFHGHDGILI